MFYKCYKCYKYLVYISFRDAIIYPQGIVYLNVILLHVVCLLMDYLRLIFCKSLGDKGLLKFSLVIHRLSTGIFPYNAYCITTKVVDYQRLINTIAPVGPI